MAEAVSAGAAPLASQIFDWSKLVVRPTKAGEFRPLFDAPTATLRNFECHATTLNPGETPHPPHRHPDEEFVIVKEGSLEVTINGVTQHASAGAALFIASNDVHGWKNAGTDRATYFVFRMVTADTPTG